MSFANLVIMWGEFAVARVEWARQWPGARKKKRRRGEERRDEGGGVNGRTLDVRPSEKSRRGRLELEDALQTEQRLFVETGALVVVVGVLGADRRVFRAFQRGAER